MAFVDQKPVPNSVGARLVYRFRQLLAFPFSFLSFLVGGVAAIVGALLVLVVVTAALLVAFLCLVVWCTSLAISPHGIDDEYK